MKELRFQGEKIIKTKNIRKNHDFIDFFGPIVNFFVFRHLESHGDVATASNSNQWSTLA